MAYQEFAYWYDFLNQEADYDALVHYITKTLKKSAISSGIIADLGCGTGEVSLRLANQGFEIISIDKSTDMLSVFQDKLAENPPKSDVLLLNQDLVNLDLYGTIHSAISTFDTFNHIPLTSLQRVLQNIFLFLEPGGVLLFDANTPYKHQIVLANNKFDFSDDDGFECVWQNNYNNNIDSTSITIEAKLDGELLFSEIFEEYSYSRAQWEDFLQETGFIIEDVRDGETFTGLTEQSQRYIFTAVKPKEKV